MAGLTASQARELVVDAGLVLRRIVLIPGTPGIVIRSEPSEGEPVDEGAQIILYIGVMPDRISNGG